tara:strand:- start:203 stop:1228 length:1026 start_codon:yes stop_codon:yes gene_type:complete
MFIQRLGSLDMIDNLPVDLHELYSELYSEWKSNLSVFGIKFPVGINKIYALLSLYAHIGRPITQVEMIDWINEKGGHYNRQARHLGGADGWNISSGNSRATLLPFDNELKRDELMLVSVHAANPIWLNSIQNSVSSKESTSDKIQRLQNELEIHWKQNLKSHGVTFPSGDGKLLPLLGLYESIGLPLTQSELTNWVELHGGSYNKQARHLAGVDGWYLISGNKRSTLMENQVGMKRDQLMLQSILKPNPIWVKQHQLTRIYELSLGEWDHLLDAFTERGCAVCGRHFDHYDKGHLDPSLSAALDNIVPMCTECNNWAGASNIHFELDKRSLIARPSRNSHI